jgi:hypothetical protein
MISIRWRTVEATHSRARKLPPKSDTQDLVRGCSLGFAAAAISGD